LWGGIPGVLSRSALLNPRLPSGNPLGCSEAARKAEAVLAGINNDTAT
jgi:hypothetical protein